MPPSATADGKTKNRPAIVLRIMPPFCPFGTPGAGDVDALAAHFKACLLGSARDIARPIWNLKSCNYRSPTSSGCGFKRTRRPATWGTAIVVLAGLVVWFVVYQRDQKQTEASEALSDVAIAQTSAPLTRVPPMRPTAYLKVAATYPNSDRRRARGVAGRWQPLH